MSCAGTPSAISSLAITAVRVGLIGEPAADRFDEHFTAVGDLGRRLIAAGLVGEQRCLGGGDEARAGAVVEAQAHDLEARVVLQFAQVAGVGSREVIDGLVGVSDGEDLHAGVGEREHDAVKNAPEVLVLVDAQPRKAGREQVANDRVRLDDRQGVEDHAVEVDRVRIDEQLLIAPGDR